MTASTGPGWSSSRSPSAATSPSRKVTLSRPRSATRRRARAACSPERSIPSTEPLGPTSRAARIVVSPAPEPRSATCMPGRRPAWASSCSVTGSKEAGLRHQPPFFLGAVAGPGVRVRVGGDGLAHPTASLVTSDSKSAAGGAPPLTAVRAYSTAMGPCQVDVATDVQLTATILNPVGLRRTRGGHALLPLSTNDFSRDKGNCSSAGIRTCDRPLRSWLGVGSLIDKGFRRVGVLER